MADQEALRLIRELARRIHEEALADPSSPYAGKFVGIINGQVAFVMDDHRAAIDRLREMEPNSRRHWIVEGGRDYPKVDHA